MSLKIGLNVIETEGRATPSIQPAATSVAAFLVRSERGVENAVRCVTNWRQFTEYFGGYTPDANGAYAVRGFFDNGGSTAYVTRLVETRKEATAAYLLSGEEGPFVLSSADNELTIRVDDDVEHIVEFSEPTPAQLFGGPETFDLRQARDIVLTVSGEVVQEYEFQDEDFEDNSGEVTAEQVARVISNKFRGITTTNHEGQLTVRTVATGEAAYLAISGSAGEVLGLSGEANGRAGNVEDIGSVSAEEASSAIGSVLTGTEVVDGTRVRITHAKSGADHTLEVIADVAGSAHEAFGFESFSGSNAIEGVTAAHRYFKDGAGKDALKVTAGYLNDEDPGPWGKKIKIRTELENPEEEPPQTNQLETYRLMVFYENRGKDELVETWTGLTVSDPTNHPETRINNKYSGSKFIKVTVVPPPPGVAADPMATGDSPLALNEGGDADTLGDADNEDADNESTLALKAIGALSLFETEEVQLLCCPESHDSEWVVKALDYCEGRGDCMFVGHTPDRWDRKAALGYGKSLRADKKYGALYFPWIQVTDPLGGRKWVPPTGHVMGVYARIERERGIWKAPAGNAARVRGALDIQHRLTDTDHTALVKQGGVNAVRFVPGKGIVIDSSRTLSTNPLWLYVNVRLLFNFVKSSLKEGLSWVKQEPNDETLWKKVKYNSVIPFLTGLWRRGAFGPGPIDQVFEVKVDGENNPPENIQQGLLNIEVYFCPSRPAETIVISIGQHEGGATANES